MVCDVRDSRTTARSVLKAVALAAALGFGCSRGGGGGETSAPPPAAPAPGATPAPAATPATPDAATEAPLSEGAALIEALKKAGKDPLKAPRKPCKRKGKPGEDRCIPAEELNGPAAF